MSSRQAAEQAGVLVGARKSGHAGTLDPLATGVLVVCVGRATLLTRFLAGGMKDYSVTAELGLITDTYDTEGRVTGRRDTGGIALDDVKREAAGFVGDIEQVPPPYSAVKLGGKPLYRYARAGAPVEPRPRRIFVEEMKVTGFEAGSAGARFALSVTCGPGTYVRSLVHDMGARLGCGACVSGLRRTRSGVFRLEDSHTLEELRSEETGPVRALLTMESATAFMPTVGVSGDACTAVSQGKPLLKEWVARGGGCECPDDLFRVLDEQGRLLALYGAPRAGDPEEFFGRAVRVIRPNTLKAEDDEAA